MSVLLQVTYSCFVLHNYCEINNEQLPEQNLESLLSIEKRVQPATSNLNYSEAFNEKRAKNIRKTFSLYSE